MSDAEALLRAARTRIVNEIDEAFLAEQEASKHIEMRERHAYALGLARALKILRDFLPWL